MTSIESHCLSWGNEKQGGKSAPAQFNPICESGAADAVACAIRCVLECLTGSLNWQHALHGVFDRVHCPLARNISNRPMLPQPKLSLLDGGDLLSVTAFGDDECQGFAPAYFYHRFQMGMMKTESKGREHDRRAGP